VVFGANDAQGLYKPKLLPTQQKVWADMTSMAALGPKFTGNPAHVKFVDFLANRLTELKLEVTRDHYTFPRWDAKHWAISVANGGAKTGVPVTSYFPYSGQTPRDGVTGELVYVGKYPDVKLENLQGKIALVDFVPPTRKFSEMYQLWGVNPPGDHFPSEWRPARAAVNDLAKFKDAGAIGVILAWNEVSDANAADQYTPFSRPPQGIPALYVGQATGAKLKDAANSKGTATLVLEAEVFEQTPTDSVLAILPGTSRDEVIIVNTHTDGTNATEENGGVAILALAEYFAKFDKADRNRTLVFPLTTGHFAGPWVPSIRGFISAHPDLMKRAAAAVTVEHLGCKQWIDNSAMQYVDTGKNEWSVAITETKSTGETFVEELRGSPDRAGVVNPVHGGWLGEGSALAKAGIPTIGYIPQPNYLLASPANGCIEKLDAGLMHSQIEVFAKTIHRFDQMTAAQLKGA
jgi:hypothetical protein